MTMTKAVLKSDTSGNVIFDFKAKEITSKASSTAEEFISQEAQRASDFKIDPLAAEQAGIASLQRQALNDRIEEEALQQLKVVQEKAYREAYDLGLAEGREQAFNESKSAISLRLGHLDNALVTIENLKSKLVADHESQIVSMIYGLAKKIAVREIQENPDSIVNVILQIVADAQSEETVTIRLSQDDMRFIETIRDKSGKAAEPLKRLKLEVGENITSGGCILSSNYGTIDATLEMRLERAWKTISDRLPKPEDRSGSDSGDGDGA